MKLLTNLIPTLVFRIWVSPWVSKQKTGSPNISESLILCYLKQLFCDWVNRNLFNDHYTTFSEIGLKALLIQGFHDEIVIKKCNVYKIWVSFWVSIILKNVILYLLL